MRNFCFLKDSLPTQIKVNEQAIELDTRTSTAIACLLYMENSEIPNFKKAEYVALRLFHKPYNEVLRILSISSDRLDVAIMKYLQGADEIRPKAEKTSKKTFDFVQDSSAIISSFRQMYNLSLEDVQNLHYWEFLALFENLSGENAFNNVRQIRAMKIDNKDSAERKEEIRKLKRSVALVDTRTAEQKKADLQEQLNALCD